MVVFKDQQGTGPRDPALAGSRPADRRSGQPDFAEFEEPDDLAPEEIDPEDTTTILLGSQAITGRAVNSAARMSEAQDARHAVEERKAKHDAQQARELASLAAWNKQQTTMGGVCMTNEQAQAARRYFLAHEDECAQEAVKMGLIKSEDVPRAQYLIHRKTELEDKKGRGILTEDDRHELREVDADPVLQGTEKAAVRMFQNRDRTLDGTDNKLRTAAAIQSSPAPAANTSDYFQPSDIGPHFAAASAPAQSGASRVAPATPAPVAAKVEVSGLAL